jgi:hypothetical protein
MPSDRAYFLSSVPILPSLAGTPAPLPPPQSITSGSLSFLNGVLKSSFFAVDIYHQSMYSRY